MVFSSPIFLFVFLPVTYLGCRLLPGLALRNAWLTLASLVFFSFGQLPYLVLLLVSVFINYVFGLWLQSGEPHRRLAAGLRRQLIFCCWAPSNMWILSSLPSIPCPGRIWRSLALCCPLEFPPTPSRG